MQPTDTLTGVIKNGVLVLNGFVMSIREDMEQLVVKDGLRGREVERKFSRAHCPVSRIVATRAEGYITLAAMRWMHSVGVSFVQLDYDGTPMFGTIAVQNVPTSLRRKQSLLSPTTGVGAGIAHSLIAAKVAGQIETLRRYAPVAAREAKDYANRIDPGVSVSDLLGIEGIVSVLYWGALTERKLHFAHQDKVSDLWRIFGTRRSPLTRTPRRSTTPGNSLLNYIYSVAASEITISLHSIGLDPALGILHVDKDNRMSLAYDLIEPARPIIDRWFFEWLETTTFSKRDFAETSFGDIRITHPLTSHLAMTSALWRGLADDITQWFYKRLTQESDSKIRLHHVPVQDSAGRRPKQWAPGNTLKRPIPSTCMECGKTLRGQQRKFCGGTCMIAYHGEDRVIAMKQARTERLAKGEPTTPRRSNIKAMTVREWRQQPGWSREQDAKMLAWFTADILPRLKTVQPAAIRKATGMGSSYSIALRNGRKMPHPRYIHMLAAMMGVEWPFDLTPSLTFD